MLDCRGFESRRRHQKMFPLLRLADFCGAPRRVLAKTGALRQQRLRCIVRRTRSALLRNRDSAGTWRPALRRRALRASLSAPAAVGGTGKMFPLLRLADFCGAPRRVLAKTGARRQRRLPVSSTGRGRRRCGSFPADRPARGTEGPMCFCKKSEKFPAFRYGSAAPAVPSPPFMGVKGPGKCEIDPAKGGGADGGQGEIHGGPAP